MVKHGSGLPIGLWNGETLKELQELILSCTGRIKIELSCRFFKKKNI